MNSNVRIPHSVNEKRLLLFLQSLVIILIGYEDAREVPKGIWGRTLLNNWLHSPLGILDNCGEIEVSERSLTVADLENLIGHTFPGKIYQLALILQVGWW